MPKTNKAFIIAVNPQQGKTKQYIRAYTYQSVNGQITNEIIQTISCPKLACRYKTALDAADMIGRIISRKDLDIFKDDYQVLPIDLD